MDKSDCLKKLKTCHTRLPESRVESVLRLAGLDDGGHLGECEQFVRDARVYPAMEAAALGFSYLPPEQARQLADYMAETMGLADGPTYCHVCGTRDKSLFDAKKSVDACSACFDEYGPPDECSKCGKKSYEGDWYGPLVWTELAARRGLCQAGQVGQGIGPDYESSEDRLKRDGLIVWNKERYVCDGCMGW